MGAKPEWAEDIARERIAILFREADETFDDNPERSDRYVEIARTIAMTFNIALPREYQETFCSGCGSYLKPGRNARVRVENGVRTMTCDECGATERFPYDG